MDTSGARRRFAASPVARLATVRPDGSPHVVPVTFAVEDDTVYTVVDAKPKRSRRLQRLANLEAEPRCALLVDHYADDWSRLWWVRADGRAEIVDDPSSTAGLGLLIARYPAYIDAPPEGPMIVVSVARWRGWSAA
jgi:PPOX class probable F420-dependent enzyme